MREEVINKNKKRTQTKKNEKESMKVLKECKVSHLKRDKQERQKDCQDMDQEKWQLESNKSLIPDQTNNYIFIFHFSTFIALLLDDKKMSKRHH